MSSSATKVDETTLSEKDDVSARGHGVSVDLGLDVDALLGVGLEPCDVDLDVAGERSERKGVVRGGREASAH